MTYTSTFSSQNSTRESEIRDSWDLQWIMVVSIQLQLFICPLYGCYHQERCICTKHHRGLTRYHDMTPFYQCRFQILWNVSHCCNVTVLTSVTAICITLTRLPKYTIQFSRILSCPKAIGLRKDIRYHAWPQYGAVCSAESSYAVMHMVAG